MAESPCLEAFEVGFGSTVLDEHRSHTQVRDFHPAFRAAAIEPETQKPVGVVAKYTAGGTPLMWYSADFSEIVVNQAALSDLTVVDATNLAPGATLRVGQRNEIVLGLLSNRDLVRFLLDARVIATWVHLGANLCLAAEATTDAGVYSATVTGTHTMFTNEERTEKLHFVVEIDDDGVVTVRGA